MSDKVYLGRNVSELGTSPAFDAYSKVVVVVGDDADGNQIVYEAGDDTGRTLEVTNPWGTQEIADGILARIRGYAYQPFTAAGSLLDPAAELGDAVTVGGVYSVLASQDVSFGALTASDISAPSGGETDHEYGVYQSSAMKEIARRIASTRVSLTVDINGVVARVDNLATQTTASLSVLDGKIVGLASTVDSQGDTLSTAVLLDPTGVMISNQTGRKITIDSQNLAISFSQLTDAQAKQLQINTALANASTALSEAEAAEAEVSDLDMALEALKENIGYTYINGQWVISPNIKGTNIYGCRYWDLNGKYSMNLTNPSGTHATLLYGYGAVSDADDTNTVFGVDADYVDGSSRLYLAGKQFLRASPDIDRVSPTGNWNFSAATVTGLYLRFS